jgi:hypothetical protein
MALENNQIDNTNTSSDEISLKDLIFKIKDWISYLKSKWKIIFIVMICGGIIGLTIALYEKPKYKAILTFVMEDEKSGGMGGALGLASSLGIDLGGGGSGGVFTAGNISELMKSRLMVFKVLLKPLYLNGKKTNLAEYYIELNELRKGWENIPVYNNIHFYPKNDPSKFTSQQNLILMGIHRDLISKEKLSIMQKDKKVSILSIEVTSENEIFSKIFCENLAKEASDFYIETKSKKARINVEILQKQLDSVKTALNMNIAGAAAAFDNIYNLNPALNIKGAPSKKRQIDVQANTAIFTNIVGQLELAKISLRKETPLIQLIDTPVFPLIKEKFGKLKSIILGGFLSGFLFILYLIFGRMYKKMVS